MGFFSSSKITDEKKAEIDNKIKTSHVFVASKSYCPYCHKAKSVLKDSGVSDADIIELDKVAEGSAIQNYLEEVTGQRTVPNIFINGKHIGGCDALLGLESSGKLKSIL